MRTEVSTEKVCGACGLERGTEALAREFRYMGGEHICWARDPKCLADACRWMVKRALAAEAEARQLRAQLVAHFSNPDCTGVAETCPVDECGMCAVRECPGGESLHYHHDGCPYCAQAEATP